MVAQLQEQNLELPFKPFTIDEVKSITGVTSLLIDKWVQSERAILRMQHGSGSYGLDYMQTFGVFVGVKYLLEGSPLGRAESVIIMLACTNIKTLEEAIASGNTFPCPYDLDPNRQIPKPGIFVKPPQGVLGSRLNLVDLFAEYLYKVKCVFPKG